MKASEQSHSNRDRRDSPIGALPPGSWIRFSSARHRWGGPSRRRRLSAAIWLSQPRTSPPTGQSQGAASGPATGERPGRPPSRWGLRGTFLPPSWPRSPRARTAPTRGSEGRFTWLLPGDRRPETDQAGRSSGGLRRPCSVASSPVFRCRALPFGRAPEGPFSAPPKRPKPHFERIEAVLKPFALRSPRPRPTPHPSDNRPLHAPFPSARAFFSDAETCAKNGPNRT